MTPTTPRRRTISGADSPTAPRFQPDQATISAQILHDLSRRGLIDRILWLHRTDRWYFGDFLRHAPWLGWLRQAFPTASIDLASHPAYLPLFGDDRFCRLLDATSIGPRSLRCYDLVIQPSAYEPASCDDGVPLLLTTWDTGWAVRVNGRPELTGVKRELNYFRAAHPSAIAGPRNTRTAPLKLSPTEIDRVTEALWRAFPDEGPIVVYNPTASNPFTRNTHLPKEVDNALTAEEHALILRRLIATFADHHFIVGASLKPNDVRNARTLQTVTSLCPSKRVLPVTGLHLPEVTTIRGFAALLASDRVCSVTGSGTGTNSHLAALSGTCALSIERGADAHMLTNWARRSDFQMGSFRWRNPSTATAIHTLDWADRTQDPLTQVADGFACHHHLAHDDSRGHQTLFDDTATLAQRVARFHESWAHDPADAIRAAAALTQAMTPSARAHHGRFDDEAAYLNLNYGVRNHGLHALIEALDLPPVQARATAVQLFEDSNLHKLLTQLAARATPAPTSTPTPAPQPISGMPTW